MEQPQYNMFHRDKFEVEYGQLYKNYGLGTTIWSPLASGLLTGKYNEGKIPKGTRLEKHEFLRERSLEASKLKKAKKLTALAGDLGTTTALLALAWCLKNPNVSTIITGASKQTHLKENLKASALVEKLDEGVMEKIEKILKNKPQAPTW